MAYGDQLDGHGNPHPCEPATAGPSASPATAAPVVGHDGDSREAGAGADGGGCGAQSVGPMDSVAEPASDAPGADLEPSSALRVVDTIRLFNGTQLGRVLNERQLHRHRVRAGRSFVQAPRNKYSRICVLSYVAWLAEYRHLASQTGPLSGNVNHEGITRILGAQSYRCALTGRHLQPEDASLDHIVPVSRGGPHLLENVQVLHTAVNRAKGALTTAEFISLCHEVAAWADHLRDQEHAHV